MATEKLKGKKKYYLCDRCGVAYKEKSWAEKCYDWCKMHNNSCNIEIVKHSVKI